MTPTAQTLNSLVDKTVQTELSDHSENNYQSNSTLSTAYEKINLSFKGRTEQDDEIVVYQEAIRECEFLRVQQIFGRIYPYKSGV